MVCREPYANTTSSTVDSPISSQYDEMDALLIFDNVFVLGNVFYFIIIQKQFGL